LEGAAADYHIVGRDLLVTFQVPFEKVLALILENYRQFVFHSSPLDIPSLGRRALRMNGHLNDAISYSSAVHMLPAVCPDTI